MSEAKEFKKGNGEQPENQGAEEEGEGSVEGYGYCTSHKQKWQTVNATENFGRLKPLQVHESKIQASKYYQPLTNKIHIFNWSYTFL